MQTMTDGVDGMSSLYRHGKRPAAFRSTGIINAIPVLLQVHDRSLKHGDVLIQHSERTIAEAAEQAPNFPGFMAVIHSQSATLPASLVDISLVSAADGAFVSLRFGNAFVLINADAEPQPQKAVGSLAWIVGRPDTGLANLLASDLWM